MIMMNKIISLILLVTGGAVCFLSGLIAEKIFHDNSEGMSLKIKAAAYVFVLLALLVLFI